MSMRYLMICGHVLYIDYWFESRTKKCHRELVMETTSLCCCIMCSVVFSCHYMVSGCNALEITCESRRRGGQLTWRILISDPQ
jgi:hypothetical protein